MRREVDRLVERLAGIPGLEDVAMTTNGSALARRRRRSRTLGCAGSPSASTASTTRCSLRLTTSASRASACWRGIDAAAAAGLGPMEINMVVKRRCQRGRGCSDGPPLPWQRPRRALHQFMDVGDTNGWRMDEVVPAAQIVAMIDAATCRRRRSTSCCSRPSNDATGEELEVIWELEPGAQAIDRPELPRVDVARIEEALANLTTGRSHRPGSHVRGPAQPPHGLRYSRSSLALSYCECQVPRSSPLGGRNP